MFRLKLLARNSLMGGPTWPKASRTVRRICTEWAVSLSQLQTCASDHFFVFLVGTDPDYKAPKMQMVIF